MEMADTTESAHDEQAAAQGPTLELHSSRRLGKQIGAR